MAFNIFGGNKESSQTFTPFQSNQFNTLLDSAQNQFLGEGFFAEDKFGGIDPLADRSQSQLDFISRLGGKTQGLSNQALSQLQAALGPYDPSNQALQASIDLVGRDITENLRENVLPSVDQGAIQAGQFGSSRQGVAESIALENANEAFADAATRMRFQDQSAFQDRQQDLLRNLGSVTSGVLGSGLAGGDIERSDRQAEIDLELERFAHESGLPLANLQAFRDLISGNMGGTTTGVTEGGGLGGLFGTLAGSFLGGPAGGALGNKLFGE